MLQDASYARDRNHNTALGHQLTTSKDYTPGKINELQVYGKKKYPHGSPESEKTSGHPHTVGNEENSCYDAQGNFNPSATKIYTLRSLTEEELQKLQNELSETKHKLKVVTSKFGTTRKDRDQLKKENKELQEEVLELQSNIRQMVPGFSNTSNSFPMYNELINKASEFIKCDCQDTFFDLLCPQLNMDGIVYFFTNTFRPISDIIGQYFTPVLLSLKKTLQIDDLEGPILNVLRKSYQNSWKSIFNSAFRSEALTHIMQQIQNTLKLGNETTQVNKEMIEFLKKLAEVALCLYISDPPLSFDLQVIGARVPFNPLRHECVDGFVKNKQHCIVILPSVVKGLTSAEDCVIKSQVLPVDYDFP